MTTRQKTINLVIHLEGGLIHAVYTDSPLNIRVAIQDLDVEGADLDEIATFPDGTEFVGSIQSAVFNSMCIDEVFSALDSSFLTESKTADPQQENYIKMHAKFCPNCGSANIESYGAMEADGDLAWSHVTCANCSSTWQDNYRLESFSELNATALKVIKSDSERGYWSNGQGWVFDVASATKFSISRLSLYLPAASAMDAEYIHLSDATDYIPNEINVGDQVFWNDPDQGLSSGIYTIDAVLTENGKLLHGSDICLLKNDVGSQAEVFAHELS
ncbi:hypothetical protein GO003_024975 [Methylicorpusculum oleiharenae]|uniref:hypothetical protein n=1 Tax=Methylicorpusculum oleiharenae TaxID=1338687 RepID=UPI001357F0CB|nr:hypothetical protein [Methylicorpusculum oleiharenae]MCD2453636.1 hypothetical protein [Methylicorpusculum oleiharenae]